MHLYAGDVAAIVADVGSATARFGSAGEDCPRLPFPTSVGYRAAEVGATESKVAERGATAAQFFVGQMAVTFPRERTEIRSASSGGAVQDWAVMEAVWDNALGGSTALFPDPREQAVLIAESVFAPAADRGKYAELLFEKFEVPALYFARRAVLAAFTLGRASALIVSTRASMSTVVPVVEGHALLRPARRTAVGGDMLSAELLRALAARGVDLSAALPGASAASGAPLSASYREHMRMALGNDIKAHVCRVALSSALGRAATGAPAAGAKPSHTPRAMVFELPDGTRIDVAAECSSVPELLFSSGEEAEGSGAASCSSGSSSGSGSAAAAAAPRAASLRTLPTILHESVVACHADVRKDLLKHVVLSGGGTLLPGFKERLAKETASLITDHRYKMTFTAASPLERTFGTWIGGSIMASLGTFQQYWVSKAEYDESGPGIFEHRCP